MVTMPLFEGDPDRRPRPTRAAVEQMIYVLEGAGWMVSRELGPLLGCDDRMLRELAHQSNGRILSGQRGYRLTVEATDDEVKHAVQWLQSQAQHMLERAELITWVRCKYDQIAW